MKDNGFITLDRSLVDSAIWNTNKPFDERSAWIDLLLMVNHADNEILIDGKPKIIHEGQRWTSLSYLAHRWKWSRDRVKRFFRSLEMLGSATADTTSRGTLITLTKYSFRQGQHRSGKSTDKAGDKSTDNTTDKATDKATDESQTKNEQRMIKNEQRRKEEAAAPLIRHGRVIE